MARTPGAETLRGLLPVIVPFDQLDAPTIETVPVPPRVPPVMLMLGLLLPNDVAVLMFSVPPATLMVPAPEKTPVSSNVPLVKFMMLLAVGTLIVPVDLPPPAKLRAPVALLVTTPPAWSTFARIDEPVVPAFFVSVAVLPV